MWSKCWLSLTDLFKDPSQKFGIYNQRIPAFLAWSRHRNWRLKLHNMSKIYLQHDYLLLEQNVPINESVNMQAELKLILHQSDGILLPET